MQKNYTCILASTIFSLG